jgi:hydroxymethylbilane synthase
MRTKMSRNIVIGTRGSKLAVWQAEWIRSELEKLYPDIRVSLKIIKTTGDKILDTPLAKIGGKGLFVKEIEDALLCGEADIAVHSMKDVPAELPDGLHIAAVCKREDPRDALVIKLGTTISPDPETLGGKLETGKRPSATSGLVRIPKGSVIGTSSLRRSCQLLRIRPDFNIVPLRGNLDTRLRKLDEGHFDAIVLAAAGLKRLGLGDRITEILSPDLSLPAAAQGSIGIELRTGDAINDLIAPLNDPETYLCVKAERQFLKALGGGCQAPIAAFAYILNGIDSPDSIMIMEGLVGDLKGDAMIRNRIEGHPSYAEFLGNELALKLLNHGAKTILDQIYGDAG